MPSSKDVFCVIRQQLLAHESPFMHVSVGSELGQSSSCTTSHTAGKSWRDQRWILVFCFSFGSNSLIKEKCNLTKNILSFPFN